MLKDTLRLLSPLFTHSHTYSSYFQSFFPFIFSIYALGRGPMRPHQWSLYEPYQNWEPSPDRNLIDPCWVVLLLYWFWMRLYIVSNMFSSMALRAGLSCLLCCFVVVFYLFSSFLIFYFVLFFAWVSMYLLLFVLSCLLLRLSQFNNPHVLFSQYFSTEYVWVD